MIYDVLVACGCRFAPHPADGRLDHLGRMTKVYIFTLRDGPDVPNDGTPVTWPMPKPRLKRWRREGFRRPDHHGPAPKSRPATDDKTLVWTLTAKPFRTAAGHAGQAIRPAAVHHEPPVSRHTDRLPRSTEHVGSGPVQFVEAEFPPASALPMSRNEGLSSPR